MEDSGDSLVVAREAVMIMAPAVRKLALTTHITSSVGWLGAVAGFLALSVVGLTSHDDGIVRGAYLSMHVVTWYVIVPMCIAALLTGLVQALGTPWGLFRYHWVVAKLLLTLVATVILFVHTQPIGQVARLAAETTLGAGDLQQLRLQLVGDAAAALFVLFLTTVLSVYKPWGMTAYGRRTQQATSGAVQIPSVRGPSRAGLYLAIGAVAFVLLLVVLHLLGISPGGH